MDRPTFVFLCGHRKCGTTLLLNLFDGHPDLAILPCDLTVFFAYYPMYLETKYSDEERRARLRKIVGVRYRDMLAPALTGSADGFERFQADFESRLLNLDVTDMAAVTWCIVDCFSAAFYGDEKALSGKRYILAKETSLELNTVQLRDWFKGCRFVQLLRDPRDNYAALKAGVKKYYSGFGEDEVHTLASLINRYGLAAN